LERGSCSTSAGCRPAVHCNPFGKFSLLNKQSLPKRDFRCHQGYLGWNGRGKTDDGMRFCGDQRNLREHNGPAVTKKTINQESILVDLSQITFGLSALVF